ncbi:hypothetical protein ABVF54_12725 [Enterococcus mundtii]|uniref:hypothetical protein n=1 Tax=Enterococcus mundtii TaxID=53346 RepID=UPI00336ABAB0
MKKFMFFGLISSLVLLGGCGSNETKDESKAVTADADEVIKSSDSESTVETTIKKEETVNTTVTENKIYGIDEWWEVDGEFRLKVNNVTVTEDRNQFADKEPEQVVVINYTYENIGYEGTSQDLYMRPKTVIDSHNSVAERYPARTGTKPTTVPIGATLENAEIAYGLNNSGDSVQIKFEQRDTYRNKHEAIFEIPVT